MANSPPDRVMESSSGSPAISVVVTTIPTSTSQTVDPTNSETARHRLSKIKLVGVSGLERQNYCCGHWFPSSKSYHQHLAEKAVTDASHEAKLLDLGMVRCAQCSVWVHTENIIAHLAKGHSNNKELKTPKMVPMGAITEVPRVTGDSMLSGTNIVIKVTGQSTPKSFTSNISKNSGNSLSKSGTVKLVTTSNSTLYQKVQNINHSDSNGTDKVIVRKSVTNALPMVNVGPRLVMKSLGQAGVGHLSRGHKVVQQVAQPGLNSVTGVNGVTLATTFKTPKQNQSGAQGVTRHRKKFKETFGFDSSTPKVAKRPTKGIRGGWKKKKRGPGRPRKSQLSDTPDTSEVDSLFDEVDLEDLENEPVVVAKKEEENIPTVELDLFTLPSTNEQVSVLLTEPKNPNFKVYASMDAIFVGDSALGDVTNQIGYVTDANNVVYVNPSHFLFPNVEDLENFVPSPILTMKGNKVGLTPVRKPWNLTTNKAYTPIVLKQVGVNASKDTNGTDANLEKDLEGKETPVAHVAGKSRVEEHRLKVKPTQSASKVLVKQQKKISKKVQKLAETSSQQIEVPEVKEPQIPTTEVTSHTKASKKASHKKKKKRRKSGTKGDTEEETENKSDLAGGSLLSEQQPKVKVVQPKGDTGATIQEILDSKNKERQAAKKSLIQKCVVNSSKTPKPLIAVQNREWQARGAKLKAQVMISDPESSFVPYTSAEDLPKSITSPPSKKMKLDLSPANTKDIRSFFKSGKSAVSQENTSVLSSSPVSPLSPNSARTPKRHAKNASDIRKYFSVTSPISPAKKIKEENVRSPKKLASPISVPSESTLLCSNYEDVKPCIEALPISEYTFEGFKRLTRQSGLRSKAILRLVSLFNSRRWPRLDKFAFPVDQLCDWNDELLSNYDFD
ncbi:hypothetical protein E2C01_009742 [Portunus trituberculatus]|uniref:Uncharacterized protein n=1 Tax=Portunus trituberculatus TaxID=210409 RepID=A0A5B7D6K7_PORTR|nr:hypothetical protein [Portunus trituberculatus]